MRRLASVCLALVLAACGSSGGGSTPTLTVSAATSLKSAMTAYGDDFGDAKVRASFAGSDELAAQIRQGVKPDVFASANTTLPEQLYKEGLVEKPTVFAANRLVLAVPASGAKVGAIGDLEQPGVTIAMGSPSVPVGSYTRKVLAKLPTRRSDAILANVRSNEPDVGGVVGKISQGAVDAGFVYVTDVKAASGKLRAIALPDDLQPQVSYGVAVVKGAKHPEQAKAFVDGLMSGDGRRRLEAAGFLPPPR
ncbi:molybdate ABC transporter substrate-binding protein [Candidatus Solirubrobacter pratensis]|uniref:molybdate ABC transporter substrate-binding protein n=1 Tax=Candidatus Solirubrobacter pratensis TaxID=1298857 RepID=UPI0004212A8B|nr:molybdate ABC transporter substrate-binding protein [Candidatus Solirubrobacter pratensis]